MERSAESARRVVAALDRRALTERREIDRRLAADVLATWPGRPEGGMGSKMRKLVLVALLGALAATASAQSPSVMGTWLTASGLAQVRLGPCPDPANGPICGLVVA